MNQPDPTASQRTFVPEELPSEAAVSDLVAGLIGRLGPAAEPIDALVERLAGGGSGAALLDGWRGPEAWPAGQWRSLLEDASSQEHLESLKHQAKRAFASAGAAGGTAPAGVGQRGGAGSPEAGDAGAAGAGTDAALLAYLLTLAVGRVRHGRWLTALPVDVVQDWCTAVGGVAKAPLGDWLTRAAEME